MKKIYSLKKNKDFQTVFKKGHSAANRQFVVYVLKQEGQPYVRVGLSVSKKIGNAVTRNRIKRYIREGVRSVENRFIPGIDCVIIARKPTVDMSYFDTLNSLKHALKRAGILKPIKEGQR
ncbi:ribonuclease P protein component [Camelliibacillus cellulosilyticus]|uniref:Ribonuclease P protein component n=1 Tax=Camelliibacillus cellulosilyticus TaxID=2174486 RepID=A0ABV9GR53_9BACL